MNEKLKEELENEHNDPELMHREREAVALLLEGAAMIKRREVNDEITAEWCNEVLGPIQKEISSLMPVGSEVPEGEVLSEAFLIGACGFIFNKLDTQAKMAILLASGVIHDKK